jgi:TetR/AcrR family transcriptional regulator
MKRPRDADRTKADILSAAAIEFAKHGMAGARVDAIAERSKASKRMIYYYFGSKEALFQLVLTTKLSERAHASVAPHDGFIPHLIAAQRVTLRDPAYVRLLQWEALDASPGRRSDKAPDSHRAAVYAELVAAVRTDQARGALPADLDPSHLALSLLGVALFPYLLPQLTLLFTGTSPTGPDWLTARDQFLHVLSGHLAQEADT